MTLTPQEKQAILQRQNAALQKMDAGHEELLQSLDGMETDEAFLASRWSVREVLLHLDSERYIDALEQIARGERQMLPPSPAARNTSGKNSNTRKPPTNASATSSPT